MEEKIIKIITQIKELISDKKFQDRPKMQLIYQVHSVRYSLLKICVYMLLAQTYYPLESIHAALIKILDTLLCIYFHLYIHR